MRLARAPVSTLGPAFYTQSPSLSTGRYFKPALPYLLIPSNFSRLGQSISYITMRYAPIIRRKKYFCIFSTEQHHRKFPDSQEKSCKLLQTKSEVTNHKQPRPCYSVPTLSLIVAGVLCFLLVPSFVLFICFNHVKSLTPPYSSMCCFHVTPT